MSGYFLGVILTCGSGWLSIFSVGGCPKVGAVVVFYLVFCVCVSHYLSVIFYR